MRARLKASKTTVLAAVWAVALVPLAALALSSTPLSDSVTVADRVAISVMHTLRSTLGDSAPVVDNVGLRVLRLLRTPFNEAAAIGDRVTLQIRRLLQAPLNDAAAVRDNVTLRVLRPLRTPLNEAAAVRDSVTLRVLRLLRTPLSDAAAVKDGVTLRILRLIRTPLNEAAAVRDSVTLRVLRLLRTPLNEAAAVRDNVTMRVLRLIQTPLNEAAAVRDKAIFRVLRLLRTPLTDAAAVRDGVALRLIRLRTVPVGDSAAVGDGVTIRVLRLQRVSLTDRTTVNDQVAIRIIRPTTTTLASSANPSVYGNPITFTALVASGGPLPGAGDGTVAFGEGSTVLCLSVPLDAGSAMCTVPLLPVGTHMITATYSGSSSFLPSTGTLSQSVLKADQTISFDPLPDRAYLDSPFDIDASASSGLPVTLSASGPCTVAGTTVTITGTGSCTITASQAGDASYNPAPPVSQPFAIFKADQVIWFDPLPDRTYGDPPFTVDASASSGLAVRLSATGACTAAGSTVTIRGAGSCTITATQAGDPNYNPAPPVSQPFAIFKADQVIWFDPLPDRTYGDPPFTVDASASSGLAVSLSATGACTAAGSTVTIRGAGSCTITASQPGDENYNPATPVSQSFAIDRAPLVATADDKTRPYGTANPPLTGSLVGVVPGDPITVSFSTTATPASSVGTYPITPVLSDPGGRLPNYIVTLNNGALTITPATPTITWANPADIVYGTALSGTQLNATASVPGAFDYSPPAGTILDAGPSQVLSTTFTPTDIVNYTTATATVVINVLKADQTIIFRPMPNRTFGDPPFDVAATASSALPVGFSSGSACTVAVSKVTLSGAGRCTITASQPGSANYNAAKPLSQSFAIACFPRQLPFGIPGPPGTATMAQLIFTKQEPAEVGVCTGEFVIQVKDGGGVTVGSGTFTAASKGTLVTVNLRGNLSPALGSAAFTATIKLDVSLQKGNVKTTFGAVRGPVTIELDFVKIGDVYVVTRVVVS